MKILSVVGARPNFIKLAALCDSFGKYSEINSFIVHTGQHYDLSMSELFFNQLNIPTPNINLGVGSGSQAIQTARIMECFEPVLKQQCPDLVVVFGDVNSTMACALVSTKLGIPVAHIEAGLRSFDKSMPEEINRIVTDAISDILFCSEKSAVSNLIREGVHKNKIHFVGNLMIDTLLKHMNRIKQSRVPVGQPITKSNYVVATLHRASNVDNKKTLTGIFEAFLNIQLSLPVIMPIHPRTFSVVSKLPIWRNIVNAPNIKLIDPLGYFEFIKLISEAKMVITDSGGIQEETTILKIPCLTIRENTERPITIEVGSNKLVGTNPADIQKNFRQILNDPIQKIKHPRLWDGKTAARISKTILEKYNNQQ